MIFDLFHVEHGYTLTVKVRSDSFYLIPLFASHGFDGSCVCGSECANPITFFFWGGGEGWGAHGEGRGGRV